MKPDSGAESSVSTSSSDKSPETYPENLQLPLLSLDIGMKRIGVAVCDRLGISCRGVTYMHRNDKGWPQQLLKLLREYGSKGIIAGLPTNMDGSEGAPAKHARAAVSQLARSTPLPVAAQDERVSSWTARESL